MEDKAITSMCTFVKAPAHATVSVRTLEVENAALKKKSEELQGEIARMKSEIFQNTINNSFTNEAIKDNNTMFKFYTGFTDYKLFKIFFDSLGPATGGLTYYKANNNPERLNEGSLAKRGRKRNLKPEQELFLALVRLRCGLLEKDIAYRAGISTSYFSKLFITWIDFLHAGMRSLPLWPTRETVDETMPTAFKIAYPSTHVISDATEIYIEMPNSLQSQSSSYSQYKHHNTAKGLIGIAPYGALSCVSDLYAGRCSDKAITKDCGILDLLQTTDSVMADKGFTITDISPSGVSLTSPPFLKDRPSLSIEEETETQCIASVRVHVERAIRHIKTYKIPKSVFPISMAGDLNKICVICSYLTNVLPPLHSNDEKSFEDL